VSGRDTSVWPDHDFELAAAVATLPERERTAIALRYGADLTEPQIADVMDVAVGTVSATLHHARARLRSALAVDEVSDDRH
jgi:RNA polymerase sigma-70 factor (ECF subfamily)